MKTENYNCNMESGHYHCAERFALGAIIAGVLVTLAYKALFHLLGVGVGLFSFEHHMLHNLGAAAIVWLALSAIIAMWLGGWFAGKFSHTWCKVKQACHGIIAWSVVVLISLAMATHAAGAMISGMLNMHQVTTYQISRDNTNNKKELIIQEDQQNVVDDQQDPDGKKMDKYIEDMGKAAIIMFVILLLSGIAAAHGAVCGGRCYTKNCETKKHDE